MKWLAAAPDLSEPTVSWVGICKGRCGQQASWGRDSEMGTDVEEKGKGRWG